MKNHNNVTHEYRPGQRVILTHPTMGRDYATYVGPGKTEGSLSLNVDGRYYNPQDHWPSAVRPAKSARDMVIGDLLNLGMLKEVFEVEFLGSLWTDGDSGLMTPHVCDCSFGDGLKLIKIFTINQRPNYHIVRVDSGWSESNWADGEAIGHHIDDVLSAIEEECGRAGECLDEPCEDCGDTSCRCGEDYSADKEFPALDDRDGCSWAEISWPEIYKKIGLRGRSYR